MIGLAGLVLLGLTLYVSTLAYALRDYSRAQLAERLGDNGQRRWLDWLDEHESELQGLAGFARVLANFGVLVCVGAWYLQQAQPDLSVLTLLIPVGITVALLLVFAIGIPHSLAIHGGEAILSRSFLLLKVMWVILWPLARLLAALEFVVRRLLGIGDETDEEENERMEQEILDALSEGEAFGAVDEDQKEIIESVFELADTKVSAIMTPRTDMNAIPASATYEEARDAILKGGHSRIPVFDTSIDHIVGVLYAKDLLRLSPGETFEIRKLMRIAPYVPESKSVVELLNEFRQTRVQIAIVLDEYGGTAGLATIEDILEELVGEIDDEYDRQPPPAIDQLDDNTLEVDARVHVDEVNEELGVSIPEDGDYETVGGFVFSKLGKIPTVGEEFTDGNLTFKVVDAEPRKINRVRISVERVKAESAANGNRGT